MYIAYLAGPITGLSYGDCVDWRERMQQLLPPDIVGMSPMRGKAYLTKEAKITSDYSTKVLSSSRGIMTRDYNDCKRADVLIVNFLGSDKVSIGTIMELAWAKAFSTPVICIIEDEGNVHEHPMVREAIGFRVKTLEEAALTAAALLLPVPHAGNYNIPTKNDDTSKK